MYGLCSGMCPCCLLYKIIGGYRKIFDITFGFLYETIAIFSGVLSFGIQTSLIQVFAHTSSMIRIKMRLPRFHSGRQMYLKPSFGMDAHIFGRLFEGGWALAYPRTSTKGTAGFTASGRHTHQYIGGRTVIASPFQPGGGNISAFREPREVSSDGWSMA